MKEALDKLSTSLRTMGLKQSSIKIAELSKYSEEQLEMFPELLKPEPVVKPEPKPKAKKDWDANYILNYELLSSRTFKPEYYDNLTSTSLDKIIYGIKLLLFNINKTISEQTNSKTIDGIWVAVDLDPVEGTYHCDFPSIKLKEDERDRQPKFEMGKEDWEQKVRLYGKVRLDSKDFSGVPILDQGMFIEAE
jgi:hypothetical protein